MTLSLYMGVRSGFLEAWEHLYVELSSWKVGRLIEMHTVAQNALPRAPSWPGQ